MMCPWLMRVADAGEYNLTILTSQRHIIQLLQFIYSKVVENSTPTASTSRGSTTTQNCSPT